MKGEAAAPQHDRRGQRELQPTKRCTEKLADIQPRYHLAHDQHQHGSG